MRYHTEEPTLKTNMYGEIYICDHPVYSKCTLYRSGNIGLAVIQQRYDPEKKITWWGEIDSWLADKIYLTSGFAKYFNKRAKPAINGLYPTVSVRQIMWALKIKPLKRERWETVFDRREV